MAKVSRRESEQRQQAMMNFFLSNPTATGEEGQAALISGKLTGSKGPPMGVGMLFRIQRQARQLARQGVMSGPQGDGAALSPGDLAELRKASGVIARVLAGLPGVKEVIIDRSGPRLVRHAVKEERL
jgi:hypothetical protein